MTVTTSPSFDQLDQLDAPAEIPDPPRLTWSSVVYAEGLREYANLGSLAFAVRPVEDSNGCVTLSIAFDNSDAEYCAEPFGSRDEAKAEAEVIVRDFQR